MFITIDYVLVNKLLELKETDWAYLAGMIDGEGYMGITRHYKDKSKSGTSKRGYEIETRLCISSMNERELTTIGNLLALGHVSTVVHIRKNSGPNPGYELRFCPNHQRIIFPRVIPYLIQKKHMAKIILQLLDYRSMKNKNPEEREKFYLQLEDDFRNAVMAEKPWLLKTLEVNGKLDTRNRNFIKAYQTHSYVRNVYASKSTQQSEHEK